MASRPARSATQPADRALAALRLTAFAVRGHDLAAPNITTTALVLGRRSPARANPTASSSRWGIGRLGGFA